jgi:adenosylmethionine-8-amino-7-oxononanoate aminotransferase
MSDLLILGTDTGAGKTTFAALWLAAFVDQYEYWKPLESGESDTATVGRLVPTATVHRPLRSFAAPVAPLLAGRQDQTAIPPAQDIALARPRPSGGGRYLLVETFGGPFSPLNEDELQVALIRALDMPSVLVTPATVGAIGRCLQCLGALAACGIEPAAVVLLGHNDPFAVEQLGRHWQRDRVWCLGHRLPQSPAAMWEIRQALTSPESEGRKQEAEGPQVRAYLEERDRQSVWHPYTSLGDPDEPLVCLGAQDEFLQLTGGRRVIDAISSWWTILHGHRHPALMSALEQSAKVFDHVHFAGVTHEPAVELAELMLATMPWRGGRVFYSDNGSTAVEVALKMAYQFWCHHDEPQRTRFIGFEGGYHGDTFGAMAVGRDPVFFGRFEPLLFETAIVPLSAECLDAELIRQRGKVAAVIVEPLVQGAGGMRMHTPQQLRQLFEVARRHGVLFIADEVMTCGRTATLWAHEAAAIAPDLVCAGKTLAGGVLPLAATLVAPHVVAAWQTDDRTKTFFHGHSFTAHPLACAVGLANWKTLLPQSMPARARIERSWREQLTPLGALPQVREVRICGTIAAVELAVDGGYLATVGRQMRQVCLEHDVLCRPLGHVLYAMPPLLSAPASLTQIAEAMGKAVRLTGHSKR